MRLHLYQPYRVGELLRVQHRREPDLVWTLARKTQSYWRSEIGVRWQNATSKIDGLRGKWVNEFDLALASGEPTYRGHCGINTRWSKSHRNLPRLLAAHCDKRRSWAFASHARNNKLAAHIEFVGRNQLVILWLPEAIRICAVAKQIFTSIRRRNV